MTKFVIKSNGQKEVFKAEKIKSSIEKAVISAGHDLNAKKGIVNQVVKETVDDVREKAEVASSDLKKEILDKLDELDASVSDAWRKFDQKYKSVKKALS